MGEPIKDRRDDTAIAQARQRSQIVTVAQGAGGLDREFAMRSGIQQRIRPPAKFLLNPKVLKSLTQRQNHVREKHQRLRKSMRSSGKEPALPFVSGEFKSNLRSVVAVTR